ncbi:hypothetical protein MES5069_1050019 [Mesorhizobium escarrei]|uniref:Transposase n=1 Tax=Mesorhizobium escarrei TaxID=666018 RepID=A0ABN8JDW1_9HYPH|nr:hypothetical protein MES5069_1050019 [Mesorhizobium escarrei]
MKWGAAKNSLWRGKRLGHKPSSFHNQPWATSPRLRAGRVLVVPPAMSEATWYLDGTFWQCSVWALPTSGRGE